MGPIKRFLVRRKWKKARKKVRAKWKDDLMRLEEYKNTNKLVMDFVSACIDSLVSDDPKKLDSEIRRMHNRLRTARALVREAKKRKNTKTIASGRQLMQRIIGAINAIKEMKKIERRMGRTEKFREN